MRRILAGIVLFNLLVATFAVAPPTYAEEGQLAPQTSDYAAGPPRPPFPPRPPAKPSANLSFIGANKILSPEKLAAGVAMTYTMEVRVQGNMPAQGASLEIPFFNDQKFISFESDNKNFTLREPMTGTVFVDMGNLKPGQGGKIVIKAKFASDYSKPIFRQTIFLNWTDDNYNKHAGTNLQAEYDVDSKPPTEPGKPLPPPVLPAGPTGAFIAVANPNQPNSADHWYFPATGHSLQYGFLSYWLTYGSVLTLGFPISEEFSEQGQTVQYFERAVMEYHPENPEPYKVLLRSLGREAGKAEQALSGANNPPAEGSIFFAETGHWLDGRLANYWQTNGGLAQFGFPIGESRVEDDRLVQWTERARLELDLSRPFQLVQLGLLGTEAAKRVGGL